MTSIYLVRHGQASFGQQNYDQLSSLGEQQAQRLGESLRSRIGGFDKVYLGSMLRHRQTARHCLAQLPEERQIAESSWQVDGNWNEYDHQDILAQLGEEFRTAASIEAYVRRQTNPNQAFEQMFNAAMDRWLSGKHDSDYVESWNHYRSRITKALEAVVADSAGAQRVAVFSSGGPISVVSQRLLGVPAEQVMQVNWTLVNCGVTKLVSTSSRLFVSTLNDHSHFEGEEKRWVTYK